MKRVITSSYYSSASVARKYDNLRRRYNSSDEARAIVDYIDSIFNECLDSRYHDADIDVCYEALPDSAKEEIERCI